MVDPVTGLFVRGLELQQVCDRCWRLGSCRSGGRGREGGGEARLDAGGVDIGQVEQGEGLLDHVVGEEFADAVAREFDAVALVGRQGVAIADQQQVRLGEAAERGTGVGKVGGAAFAVAIRVVGVDAAEFGREGAQVQADDLSEQGRQVDKMEGKGGCRHAERLGEAGEGDVFQALIGDEVFGDVEDRLLAHTLPLGEGEVCGVSFLGLGAENSNGCWHAVVLG